MPAISPVRVPALLRFLLRSLFPQRCVLCHATTGGAALCAACLAELPDNRSACRRCALPLPEQVGARDLCGRCLKQPPAFDYAISAFRYEAEIIRLVHQLKFSERISYAPVLGACMAGALRDAGKYCPDYILPVPLHRSRLRARGFNQSVELARPVAALTGAPLSNDLVIRQRATPPQVGNRIDARRRNIRGAFTLNRAVDVAHVLIIDDVVTTGATVNELAKLLKSAGAETVGVLSLARAPLKG